jgi:hypothetical protein
MKEIKVMSGQSLLDVAIQESGAVEAAFDMALLNGISITGALVAGAVLLGAGVAGKLVADYYRAKRLKPATYTDREVLLTGIGYMVVEDNFIIA